MKSRSLPIFGFCWSSGLKWFNNVDLPLLSNPITALHMDYTFVLKSKRYDKITYFYHIVPSCPRNRYLKLTPCSTTTTPKIYLIQTAGSTLKSRSVCLGVRNKKNFTNCKTNTYSFLSREAFNE